MEKRTALFAALFFASGLHAQQTILHCGRLIDVKNKKIDENMSVVIEGNKITDVKSGYVTANPSA
ncbi:MAG TPA: hypothetical protein VFS22_02245, partial [Flavisolibacter sp.]|nr:hypothetical protein [Flavisolibacter sp.]